MSLTADIASDSKDTNFMRTIKKINISAVVSMIGPVRDSTVGTMNFMEIDGMNHLSVEMLMKRLDFFV